MRIFLQLNISEIFGNFKTTMSLSLISPSVDTIGIDNNNSNPSVTAMVLEGHQGEVFSCDISDNGMIFVYRLYIPYKVNSLPVQDSIVPS